MTNSAIVFASALLASLPIFVIAMIGAVLSRNKLPQAHAKARRLATIGFTLLGLYAIVGGAVRTYVAGGLASAGDRVAMAMGLGIANMVAYLLLAASLVLLLLAVLADRDSPISSRGAI
jgi:hypothetical protein